MKNRMIPATLPVALVSIGVSCGTEPQEPSPIAGVWVSLAEPGLPVLELALLADSTGDIFGTCTEDVFGTRVPCVVRGEYAHPDVQLTFLRNGSDHAEYTGQRVDNNTIDGNLLRYEKAVELQLKRKRGAE